MVYLLTFGRWEFYSTLCFLQSIPSKVFFCIIQDMIWRLKLIEDAVIRISTFRLPFPKSKNSKISILTSKTSSRKYSWLILRRECSFQISKSIHFSINLPQNSKTVQISTKIMRRSKSMSRMSLIKINMASIVKCKPKMNQEPIL